MTLDHFFTDFFRDVTFQNTLSEIEDMAVRARTILRDGSLL